LARGLQQHVDSFVGDVAVRRSGKDIKISQFLLWTSYT